MFLDQTKVFPLMIKNYLKKFISTMSWVSYPCTSLCILSTQVRKPLEGRELHPGRMYCTHQPSKVSLPYTLRCTYTFFIPLFPFLFTISGIYKYHDLTFSE